MSKMSKATKDFIVFAWVIGICSAWFVTSVAGGIYGIGGFYKTQGQIEQMQKQQNRLIEDNEQFKHKINSDAHTITTMSEGVEWLRNDLNIWKGKYEQATSAYQGLKTSKAREKEEERVQIASVKAYRGGTARYVTRGAEGWRSLVVKYFPASQVNKALRVIMCESSGNPNNISNPPYVGLFQHEPNNCGYSAAQLKDPEKNISCAASMFKNRGWQPWPTCA